MDYNKDIERLERELEEKKRLQRNSQENCIHDWTESKYDAEEYKEEYLTGEYETFGIHRYPKTSFTTKYRDRWSRACKKCGKIEYAYTKKVVKYEPDFR